MNKEQQEAALKLASWLLSLDGAYSSGPWERDMARIIKGIRPVECMKPRLRFSRGYWFCGTGGIVWNVGTTPVDAYRNWKDAQ